MTFVHSCICPSATLFLGNCSLQFSEILYKARYKRGKKIQADFLNIVKNLLNRFFFIYLYEVRFQKDYTVNLIRVKIGHCDAGCPIMMFNNLS